MAESDVESSPDPITQPSSPPASRNSRKKSLVHISPSRSFVIDTPKGRGSSPWRIRVTIEPQPEADASPSRNRVQSSSAETAIFSKTASPAKRVHHLEGSEEEVIRSTPRRRRDERLNRLGDSQDNTHRVSEMSQTTFAPLIPPLQQPPRRRSRNQAALSTSSRTRRLSKARDELNEALQNAVGSSQSRAGSEVAGDMTVSAHEDFSMVSMESLISVKATNTTDTLSTIPERNSRVEDLSCTPLPPVEIQYPEISGPASEARESLEPPDYDVMSWKATDVVKEDLQQTVRSNYTHQTGKSKGGPNSKRSPLQITEALSDTHRSPSYDGLDLDDDIWQEEASRSVVEEIVVESRQQDLSNVEQSEPFEDLFVDQSLKPPRPKIPRTWRRTSGHDFSYADSPAPEEVELQQRSGASMQGRSVLTPPTSDESSHHIDQPETEHSDFTQPDAVGTQFEEHGKNEYLDSAISATPQHDIASPFSDSGSSVASPDAEDTGLFWQTNLPNVYTSTRSRPKPQRQTAVDLTELLQSTKATRSVAEPEVVGGSEKDDKYRKQGRTTLEEPDRSGPLHVRPVIGNHRLSKTSSQQEKLLSSPLRKSLLKSSKHATGAINTEVEETRHSTNPLNDNTRTGEKPRPSDHGRISKETPDKSNDFAARFQSGYLGRQGRRDRTANTSKNSERHAQDKSKTQVSGHALNAPGRLSVQDSHDISRSYEEDLNLGSPTKIQVNFNDISANPSLLNNPSGPESSLPHPNRTNSPKFITLVAPKPSSQSSSAAPQNLLSRFTTSFWTAVVRPTGPTEILPTPIPTSSSPHESSNLFPSTLRTHLRNRYGVLSESFPWTMSHMRTLHRMLNSRETPRSDTLIPSSGPLPPNLTAMVDTTQTSVTGHRFKFTYAHAHVVFAFAQVLVPGHVVEAMRKGEVEWLGDPLAKRYRGWYGDRHGDEKVWKGETHRPDIVRWVDGLTGMIFLEFVARALGDVVWSNDLLVVKREDEDFGI